MPAELNNVPDDQKIARQVELADQSQFMLDLLPRLLVICSVAANHSFVGALAQKLDLRLSLRRGVTGKFVAEIGESELQAFGENYRILNCLGELGKERALITLSPKSHNHPARR